MAKLKRGTRIRTLYEYSESGEIVGTQTLRLTSGEDETWYVVRYDHGGRMCVHPSMFAVANV